MYTVLVVPWRLVHKEKAFGSVPAQGTLGPLSGVQSVFNNSDLPSTSGGQAKATAITCNVLRVSFITLANRFNRGLLVPGVLNKWKIINSNYGKKKGILFFQKESYLKWLSLWNLGNNIFYFTWFFYSAEFNHIKNSEIRNNVIWVILLISSSSVANSLNNEKCLIIKE